VSSQNRADNTIIQVVKSEEPLFAIDAHPQSSFTCVDGFQPT